MNWIDLHSEAQLKEIIADSYGKAVVIFKHSTTCNISAMAKLRLESQWDLDLPAYYLDLKVYRSLSNLIAETFKVYHESPQILLIFKGVAIYDASHFDITLPELKEALETMNHTI